MTPIQALQILDGLAAKSTGTRDDHIQLQAAIIALQNFVDEHMAPSKKETPIAEKKDKSNGNGLESDK